MNGVFNIYKEQGFTSHDVVAVMRGILHERKLGHTGTLDPMATGVLPVCAGRATKLCDLFSDRSKRYRAALLLGRSTDTEDVTGTTTGSDEAWRGLVDSEVTEAVLSFVGEYDQIPPMYSAKKTGGKKLYEYARAGVEIERNPAHLTIYSIDDITVELPRVYFTVSCSKGTYIRSLCRDIAQRLGCCGCMESLERERVGLFFKEKAVTLDELKRLNDEDRLGEAMISIDELFAGMPYAVVSPEYDRYTYNGNKLIRSWVGDVKSDAEDAFGWSDVFRDCLAIRAHSGELIGIYRVSVDELVPEKLFFERG